MVFDNIFLLQWPPILAIATISILITLFVTVVYKYTTNQKRMKQLKQEQKTLQKEYRKNMTNPKKAAEINKKLMSTNTEYMKHSFKSTLYTFLPLILIFSWMNSHFGYEQILPNQKFQIIAEFKDAAEGTMTIAVPEGLELLDVATQTIEPDEDMVWKLKGAAGEYVINYTYKDEFYQQKVLITEEWKYLLPNVEKGGKIDDVKEIKIDLQSTRPMRGVPILGGLSWLWTYILLSVISSIAFRKAFKVF